MITSIKNYTKKNKQETKRPVRALGQMVKAKVYRQNNKKKHTHTHSQKEKKENKYISVYKKKKGGRELTYQLTNLPVIINSKY